MERISILKFGGTSLSTELGRSLSAMHVKEWITEGFNPVVVVSAMGRHGDPYSTDTLISLTNESEKVHARDMDLLLSCGETISSVVFSSTLNSLGLKAMPMTGKMAGIVTDSNHGCAEIKEIRPERLLDLIAQDIIPVVSGFQGSTVDGETTTLGRGGSDITAIALASSLRADSVCIYKDVDGVMTEDPKMNSRARFLKTINAVDLLEMMNSGSKLMHPKALEIAISSGITFKIRNTYPSSRETTVYASVNHETSNSLCLE